MSTLAEYQKRIAETTAKCTELENECVRLKVEFCIAVCSGEYQKSEDLRLAIMMRQEAILDIQFATCKWCYENRPRK